MDRIYLAVETIISLGVLLSATIFSPANIAEKDVGDAFSADEFNQFINSTRLFYLDDQGTDLDTSDDMLGLGKNPVSKFDVAGSIEASGNVTATYFLGDGSLLSGIDAGNWVKTGDDINYPTGNVGVGVASPNSALQISGQIAGGFGANSTTGAGDSNDWNNVLNARSGSGEELLYASDTNGPGISSTYYHPFGFEYDTKDGSGNMTQFAIPYSSSAQNHGMYMRTRYSGVWQGWSKILSERSDTGNVGIGTLTPSHKLHVVGDINFSGDLYQGGTLFSAGKFADGTDTDDAVYMTGNVGIGDNDPDEALVVNGNIAWGSGLLKTDQGGSLELGDASSNPYIDFKNDPSSDYDVRLSLIGNDALEVSGGTLVAPEPITGTEVANKNYVDDRTAFAQITNNAVTDINSSGGVVIVFNTTALHNSDTSLFTPINTGVQVLEAGTYEVNTNLYMTSPDARTNVQVEFTINGTKQGIRAAGAYIRNNDNHDESSAHLTQILTLSANDIVGVTTTEEANTGTVALPVGQSNLIIKRLQ